MTMKVFISTCGADENAVISVHRRNSRIARVTAKLYGGHFSGVSDRLARWAKHPKKGTCECRSPRPTEPYRLLRHRRSRVLSPSRLCCHGSEHDPRSNIADNLHRRERERRYRPAQGQASLPGSKRQPHASSQPPQISAATIAPKLRSFRVFAIGGLIRPSVLICGR